jgi:hypothetical protein
MAVLVRRMCRLVGVLVTGIALPAFSQESAADSALHLRAPPLAAQTAASRSLAPAVMPKSAPVTAQTTVTATACGPCSGDMPTAPRPLISALPAGESYEVRILRSAVSGFRLRASDINAPPSADERLRLRISRQQISLAWQSTF